MTNHETMTASLLMMLSVDETDKIACAKAIGGVLATFAEIVRGPAPVASELVAGELVADETPALILVELRKLTTLAEVIAKQGERTLQYIEDTSTPICGAAALGLPG